MVKLSLDSTKPLTIAKRAFALSGTLPKAEALESIFASEPPKNPCLELIISSL